MNIDLRYDMQEIDTSGPNRAKLKETLQYSAVNTKAPLSGGSRKRPVGSFLHQFGDHLWACRHFQRPLVEKLLNVTRTLTNQNVTKSELKE